MGIIGPHWLFLVVTGNLLVIFDEFKCFLVLGQFGTADDLAPGQFGIGQFGTGTIWHQDNFASQCKNEQFGTDAKLSPNLQKHSCFCLKRGPIEAVANNSVKESEI